MAPEATVPTSFWGWGFGGVPLEATGSSLPGPWGFGSPWAPSLLPAKCYCFLCISRAREAGAGGPPCRGACLVVASFPRRPVTSGSIWNSVQGRARPFRTQDSLTTEGPFFSPRKSQLLWQLGSQKEPQALLPDEWHPHRAF